VVDVASCAEDGVFHKIRRKMTEEREQTENSTLSYAEHLMISHERLKS